jgi:hypothetical protein
MAFESKIVISTAFELPIMRQNESNAEQSGRFLLPEKSA